MKPEVEARGIGPVLEPAAWVVEDEDFLRKPDARVVVEEALRVCVSCIRLSASFSTGVRHLTQQTLLDARMASPRSISEPVRRT